MKDLILRQDFFLKNFDSYNRCKNESNEIIKYSINNDDGKIYSRFSHIAFNQIDLTTFDLDRDHPAASELYL